MNGQTGPGVEETDLLGLDAELDDASLGGAVTWGQTGHRLRPLTVAGHQRRVALLIRHTDELGADEAVNDDLVTQRLDHRDLEVQRGHPVVRRLQ